MQHFSKISARILEWSTIAFVKSEAVAQDIQPKACAKWNWCVTNDAMRRKLRLSINQLNFYWTNLSTQDKMVASFIILFSVLLQISHIYSLDVDPNGYVIYCPCMVSYNLSRKTLISEKFWHFLSSGSVRKSSRSFLRCIGICQRPWQNTCLTSLGWIQERTSKIHSDSIWHVFQRYRIEKIP